MNKKVTPFILEEKVKQIIIKPVKRALGVPPEVNALGVPPEVNALEPVTFDYNWDYFDDEGIHKTDCLHGGTYFPTLIGYFRAL